MQLFIWQFAMKLAWEGHLFAASRKFSVNELAGESTEGIPAKTVCVCVVPTRFNRYSDWLFVMLS